MSRSQPFVRVCLQPLLGVFLNLTFPYQQRTCAADCFVLQAGGLIVILYLHYINHVIVYHQGAVGNPWISIRRRMHDHTVHANEVAAGHRPVGAGHGVEVNALLVQVSGIFSVTKLWSVPVRIGSPVVEVKTKMIVLIQSGPDNVDVTDLPFPGAVEAGPLHPGTYCNSSGSGQADGRLVVPRFLYRLFGVIGGRRLLGIFHNHGIGLLALGGYPYLQLILAGIGGDEDQTCFGGLGYIYRYDIQAHAVEHLVV